ncbi:MAG: SAM-dependent methyltransferase [Treponema sp.]|nr:SAM-dependent methyltransferase [Candidatus Treponema caballi]
MRNSLEQLPGLAFLGYPEKTTYLLEEVALRFPAFGKPVLYGDVAYYPDAPVPAFESGDAFLPSGSVLPLWARCAFLKPLRISFDSIGEAANVLRDMQRNWAPYQFTQFRRAALIQEKLPYINLKPRTFPYKVPSSDMGIYTLLDANTMLASAATQSHFPAGTVLLQEDHENPPSRAYLKIEEALVRFCDAFGCDMPAEGARVLDAGACPGGWTWVLRELGCDVTAIDRAPLVPSLMEDSAVHFMTHDAFTLKPAELGRFDWIFSDVICYPERLFGWINDWLESGLCANFICTIKLQGGTDWDLINKFASIPDSRVVHLCYNKHEFTWMHCGRH